MVVEADVGYGEGVVYSVGFVYGRAFAGAEGNSVYVEGIGGGGCEGGPSLLLDVIIGKGSVLSSLLTEEKIILTLIFSIISSRKNLFSIAHKRVS